MRHSRGPLGRLFARIGRNTPENERLRALLPDDLADHCVGWEREGELLCLVMDSNAWASRARYALARRQQGLLAACDPPARQLRVRTANVRGGRQNRERGKSPTARPPERISQRSREHVREAARHIQDPELRAALERLARE
ncbi:hypothetical protein [Natronospira bacteriovora]|uniref:DUF721 domain-containing protein n=1 Tax=Natronospira bacteriovora TaxID=3069753 RepID=A0ABU0W667_9GAMM|nr:hypothetical protein [Natronospira sp. AB-CW4]MDQ2069499.1 hypothetical protein [Natronospira sp. AB-CW4]